MNGESQAVLRGLGNIWGFSVTCSYLCFSWGQFHLGSLCSHTKVTQFTAVGYLFSTEQRHLKFKKNPKSLKHLYEAATQHGHTEQQERQQAVAAGPNAGTARPGGLRGSSPAEPRGTRPRPLIPTRHRIPCPIAGSGAASGGVAGTGWPTVAYRGPTGSRAAGRGLRGGRSPPSRCADGKTNSRAAARPRQLPRELWSNRGGSGGPRSEGPGGHCPIRPRRGGPERSRTARPPPRALPPPSARRAWGGGRRKRKCAASAALPLPPLPFLPAHRSDFRRPL